MPDGLTIQPRFTAVLEHRTAFSGCCSARLNPGDSPETFTCRDCGNPCERVLSDPVEVTAHG